MKSGVRITSMIFALLVTTSNLTLANSEMFPLGGATPSEDCAECHQAIYQEYALGVGSDIHSKKQAPSVQADSDISLPAKVSSSPTAHSTSKFRPIEAGGDVEWCRSCHFPGTFTIPGEGELGKIIVNKENAGEESITCATCHLTPEGLIRSVNNKGNAPHESIAEPAMATSAVCAHCHVDKTDQRVVGKEYQTYLEWREDFIKPGLGAQQCQECHMPRTLRKIAEDSDEDPVPVGRHLWPGSHSKQRHLGSLALTVIQQTADSSQLSFSLANIGAGHSVPTGPTLRAVYLNVEVLDSKGIQKAHKEWFFAPNASARPDDIAFLEEDKKLEGHDAFIQTRSDSHGAHEAPIRAGEERLLGWSPDLTPGNYIVNAKLSYTADRFSEKSSREIIEIGDATLPITRK